MNGEQRARLEGIGSVLDVGKDEIEQVRKASRKGRLLKIMIGGLASVAAIVVGFLIGESTRAPPLQHASIYPFSSALLLTSISINPRASAAILRGKLDPKRYTLVAVLTVTIIAFVGGFLIGAANPPYASAPRYGVASRTRNGQ